MQFSIESLFCEILNLLHFVDQVYKAKLQDGSLVAVKIQRPNIVQVHIMSNEILCNLLFRPDSKHDSCPWTTSKPKKSVFLHVLNLFCWHVQCQIAGHRPRPLHVPAYRSYL